MDGLMLPRLLPSQNSRPFPLAPNRHGRHGTHPPDAPPRAPHPPTAHPQQPQEEESPISRSSRRPPPSAGSQCTSCRCEAALPVMVVLSASDFCFKNCNLHKASRVLMIPVLYQLLQGIFANRAKYFRIQIWFSSSSSQDGWTPLHLAIQSRNRDITMILLVMVQMRQEETSAAKLTSKIMVTRHLVKFWLLRLYLECSWIWLLTGL
uniref:Uncharacterized protein n=1 Tax=Oryza barthii TaxID=65489 RepID=A0A0D3HC32_9ORYZ